MFDPTPKSIFFAKTIAKKVNNPVIREKKIIHDILKTNLASIT